MTTKIKVCPVCGKEYSEHPAISRKDNKTEICSLCGRLEAVEQFLNDNMEGKENDKNYCIFEKGLTDRTKESYQNDLDIYKDFGLKDVNIKLSTMPCNK